MRTGLALVLTLVSASCSNVDEAQSVVCVYAEETALRPALTARVSVREEGGTLVTQRTVGFAGATDPPGATPEGLLPLRIPIAPKDGDIARRFEVEVEFLDSAGALVTRQTLRGGYASDLVRRYTLLFDDPCVARTEACGDGETCEAGRCVPTGFMDLPLETTLDDACPADAIGSLAGYGLAQGFESWFYGFYNRLADNNQMYDASTDFELMSPVNDCWKAEAEGDCSSGARLQEMGAHPELQMDRSNYYVPVRRWVAPFDGEIGADFVLRYDDVPSSDRPGWEAADGVTGLVWLDGREIGRTLEDPFMIGQGNRWSVAPDDTASISVRRGQRLDFGVDSGPMSSFFDPMRMEVELRVLRRGAP
ncbi:MAG: hypothetical protein AAGF12_11970 [Myxococcota bacterium]